MTKPKMSFAGESNVLMRIKFDVSEYERIVLPVQHHPILHEYSDSALLSAAKVRAYSLEEVLAEKLRSSVRRHQFRPGRKRQLINLAKKADRKPTNRSAVIFNEDEAFGEKVAHGELHPPRRIFRMLPPFFAITVAALMRSLMQSRSKRLPSKSTRRPPSPPPCTPLRLVWSSRESQLVWISTWEANSPPADRDHF